MLILTSLPTIATELQSTTSYQKQTTPIQNLKNNDDAKNLLIQILEENSNNQAYKEIVKQKSLDGIKDLQNLIEFKRTTTDPQLKKSIRSVEKFFFDITKFFCDLYTFLSKPHINEQDIQNFTPRLAQFKFLYNECNDEQAVAQKNHARQQLKNFRLLQRSHAIQKNKNYLGNLARNSTMIPNQKPVTNKAVRESLKKSFRKFQ